MPLALAHNQTTILIRRTAFEEKNLTRSALDERLGLTADEFRTEGDLIAVGPIAPGVDIADLIAEFEQAGLVYYDDFFDFSGNWPQWFTVFAMARR
jgi:hypothetical protein